MKKNIGTILLLTMMCVPVFTSCDDDDDIRPNEQITQTVHNRYPSAQIIETEKIMSGYEVEMRIDGKEVNMYFDDAYNWTKTEFEDINWNTETPEAIKNALTADGYTFNTREDDIDRIEIPDGNTTKEYYHIELDREPQDIHLYYAADGSTVNPDNGNTVTNQAANIAAAKYPTAQIIETEKQVSGYEVEMRIDGKEVNMYLDNSYNWVSTEFEDIDWNTAVPEAVKNSFTAQGYTFNPIEDDVDRIEVPTTEGTAEYYRIELDREPQDIYLSFNPDGSVRN